LKYVLTQGLLLGVAWLLWSGHYTPLLLSFGALSVLLVLGLSRRMDVIDHEGAPAHITFRMLLYIPWLAWQVVLSNLHVARVILSPSLPVNPRFIKVRASQKQEFGQVIYANSITMTPGTVTVEVAGSVLTVHALTDQSAEGLRTGDMDRRVTRVEGLS
jgi:multicomponent Na+:H+ antiporter subunit E